MDDQLIVEEARLVIEFGEKKTYKGTMANFICGVEKVWHLVAGRTK